MARIVEIERCDDKGPPGSVYGNLIPVGRPHHHCFPLDWPLCIWNMLDIPPGAKGTLLFAQEGEEPEGAVDALLAFCREWDERGFLDRKARDIWAEFRARRVAARAELALGEGRVVDVEEALRDVLRVARTPPQNVTDDLVIDLLGHLLPHPDKEPERKTVVAWKLKTTKWMCPECNHRAPAGSSDCGHCRARFYEEAADLPDTTTRLPDPEPEKVRPWVLVTGKLMCPVCHWRSSEGWCSNPQCRVHKVLFGEPRDLSEVSDDDTVDG